MEGSDEVFFTQVYKEGVTFEWIKNKVAEHLEAQYADLLLFFNGRRIPEPFCLIDMGVASGSEIIVQLQEGAVMGHEALRQQVLNEIAQEEAEMAGGTGETGGVDMEED